MHAEAGEHVSAGIDRALALLRDVPGVEGAFVIDDAGSLVARDASMGLPEWLLSGAATRLATLVESSEDAFEAPRELTLVFADRSVFVRVSPPYVLALLLKPATSMEAVRLASNVALRQIARALPATPTSEVGMIAPPSSTSPLASPTSVQPPVTTTLKSPPASTTLTTTTASRAPASSGSPVSRSAPKPAATAPAGAKKKKNDIWG